MKVSVIVPVYKVEKYLRRCVDSIVNQSFSDYEIILVDDGSPDNCPEICDEYAEKYINIRVIHKQNGGLSDARNVAVAQASGDYIIFLDSDDYVNDDYISSLWDAMKKYNADMACSPPILEYEQSGVEIENLSDWSNNKANKETMTEKVKFQEICIDARRAQAIILRGYPVGTSACAKIIEREHCLKHPFPKGKVMEELATLYHIIGETKKVVLIGKCTYHYLQRSGSILHTPFSLNEVKEYMEIAENYAINAPDDNIKRGAVERLVLLAGRLSCVANKGEEKEIYNVLARVCRKYFWIYIMDKELSFREKTRAILMSISTVTIRLFVWQKRKRKRNFTTQ